jgi:predicted Rossmann fold nucleotide-binding protein DprA/Smf involved in DNA uptake
MPRVVAIVGSREFPEDKIDKAKALVRGLVASLPIDTVIVSGGARGVDTWAVEAAKARGLPEPQIFYPDWQKHGRQAGFVRNGKIAAAADEVVAIWNGTSTGTMNTVAKARSMGKPVKVLKVGESTTSL